MPQRGGGADHAWSERPGRCHALLRQPAVLPSRQPLSAHFRPRMALAIRHPSPQEIALNAVLDLSTLPALHQPDWTDNPRLAAVKAELARQPALVNTTDLRRLRSLLVRVAAGEAHVIQAGDCAEDPAESSEKHIDRKTALLRTLSQTMATTTSTPVHQVGRLAGQFAKPRSRPTEHIDGVELPAYLGHMVNRPEPDPRRRRHDPENLLTCFAAARATMKHLGWLDDSHRSATWPAVWTSHEALVVDYELPMLRRDELGRLFLGSTHWPWIGERTRQLDGAHVAMLARVVNPVGCKVGPTMTVDDIVALSDRLDPWREPGRLTLIARMGAENASAKIPPLVEAVRAAGHPAIWLTDPMHGNTVARFDGRKTRYLDTIVREIRDFQTAVRQAGGVAGGLHLETTPGDVTECMADMHDRAAVADGYTTLCDPRLNPPQAAACIAAWQP
jgi:3-deoxy-7-phosphoheptulonate synthase